MSKHSVCILGGSGFVGSHLITRLANDGYAIKVLTRYRETHKELLVLPTLSLVQADVHDVTTLEREFLDVDVVINLVGILNASRRRGESFQEAHAELPQKVVQACKTAGVSRLLHMSALKADVNGPSEYLRTKGQAEEFLKSDAATGIHTTIFKPSVIFGSEDSFINRFAALLKIPSYLFMLPSPNTRFAPVYVGDVAEAFARAIGDPATYRQNYELCGPKVFSLKEIVEFIARTLGLRRTVIGLGPTSSQLLARVLGLLPDKPMSLDNYRSMKVHSICDQNGFAALDITPRSLEAVAPKYLLRESNQKRLRDLRTRAGR